MKTSNIDQSKKIKALLAWYNMIPNLIWSIINLTPIFIFSFTLAALKLVYIFLVVSAVPLFFTNSFTGRLKIGKSTTIYKQLGVHLINKVSQNGDIINKLIKKKFPKHKIITHNERSVARLISQAFMFEKFHWALFLFFGLMTGYSVYLGYGGWALILLLTNLAYNIYPVFLQQYIRLKLTLFLKLKERTAAI